jgi:hypothetical protein
MRFLLHLEAKIAPIRPVGWNALLGCPAGSFLALFGKQFR